MLKIDQTFINGLEGSPDQAELVQTIATLAHRLGMTVTAEGSETQETLDFLRSGPCEFVQGFSTGRPQSGEQLTHRLEDRFAAPGSTRAAPEEPQRRAGPKGAD